MAGHHWTIQPSHGMMERVAAFTYNARRSATRSFFLIGKIRAALAAQDQPFLARHDGLITGK
jgi:hypothetical protein